MFDSQFSSSLLSYSLCLFSLFFHSRFSDSLLSDSVFSYPMFSDSRFSCSVFSDLLFSYSLFFPTHCFLIHRFLIRCFLIHALWKHYFALTLNAESKISCFVYNCCSFVCVSLILTTCFGWRWKKCVLHIIVVHLFLFSLLLKNVWIILNPKLKIINTTVYNFRSL